MAFDKLNPEDAIEVRPRFRLKSKHSIPEIVAAFETANSNDSSVLGKAIRNRLYLLIPQKDHHYWSPEMQVVLEKTDDNETLIRCLIGPRQQIWVMFMFFYIAVGVIAFFGGMYGLVQWNLGQDGSWLWCFPIAAVLMIGIYQATRFGQRKGHQQMVHLIRFLFSSVKGMDVWRV